MSDTTQIDPNLLQVPGEACNIGETDQPAKLAKIEELFSREYVSKADVAEAFGTSERTVERWVREGTFCKPLKLGRNCLFHIPSLKKHWAGIFETMRKRGQMRR
ncbi:MAG: helix-turn-helix domain-containing protein [Pseudomonadota bacterium]